MTMHNRDKIRSQQNRLKLITIKEKSGCIDCGYNLHHSALEFDHLPQYDKTCSVMSLIHRSWERIMEEVNKCEIVCANCHAIRTFNRRGPMAELADAQDLGSCG